MKEFSSWLTIHKGPVGSCRFPQAQDSWPQIQQLRMSSQGCTRPGKHTKSEVENGPVEIVDLPIPIGSMYGIYANIGGILMVNVTIYGIHGSYGI